MSKFAYAHFLCLNLTLTNYPKPTLAMSKDIMLSKNALVRFLNKPNDEFTKDDIIRYVVENNIGMINLMYPAGDGRLKTLNFVITSLEYLDTVLSLGERVDGSSLFDFVEAGNSDLYVMPRFSTAFLDPFAPLPTVTMLCSYFDKDGKPLEGSPEHILDHACSEFTAATGLQFQAMGELEYYVIAPDTGVFPAVDQRGYHESGPFAKFNDFRTQCMNLIAQTGGDIKYGHSEVGNFTIGCKIYEQNEIEFLPVDARLAADQLALAKWVIRSEAMRQGLDVTFAPKITVGKAGSGLHIHIRLVDADGRSVMTEDGRLSDTAKRGIAGLMSLAPAITAFGNTNPTSYFRLVPHQEAPTSVCWGDRNRSVLVRVPLGWTATGDMCAALNPGSRTSETVDPRQKQTFEIRSADCSADVYTLLASLAVALRKGFEMPDALDLAARTYVDVNIHGAGNEAKLASLDTLPVDCADSADALERVRAVFEERGIFPPRLIDAVMRRLRAYDRDEVEAAKHDTTKMLNLVRRYFYCG